MASTSRQELSGDGWTAAYSGPGWAFIQVSGGDPVALHVGQTVPPADTRNLVVLERDGLAAVSLTSLGAGDVVYLASFNGDPTSAVVVGGP